jgi:pimeloyl-ACP methyl ester carboxylesterase
MDGQQRNIRIEFQGHKWQASLLGSGKRFLLAFHGYGQDAQAFNHLADLLNDSYTLVLMDLAYHGKNASMSEGFFFMSNQAAEFIEIVCKALETDRISLVGYSIGARIAMSISVECAVRIEELWLFAPDGMPVSGFYKFLTTNLLGISLFRGFVKRPHAVFAIIKAAQALKLLNQKAAKFYLHETADYDKRKQLFNTWMAYRAAIPSHKALNEAVKASSLSVVCVLGIDDSVIPFSRTRRFIRKHLSAAQVYELETGHNMLSDKAIRKFAEYWEAKTKKRHKAALEE